MVLDTSALVAILLDEPERPVLTRAIADAPVRALSAAGLLEAGIVLESRLGEAGGRELDLLLHRAEVAVVPVDVEQAEIARAAWRRYGKGRHAAALNYGDCFSYALALARDEPLLFVGEDFARTDVRSALAR
jgi:ribonuclease VapC